MGLRVVPNCEVGCAAFNQSQKMMRYAIGQNAFLRRETVPQSLS